MEATRSFREVDSTLQASVASPAKALQLRQMRGTSLSSSSANERRYRYGSDEEDCDILAADSAPLIPKENLGWRSTEHSSRPAPRVVNLSDISTSLESLALSAEPSVCATLRISERLS